MKPGQYVGVSRYYMCGTITAIVLWPDWSLAKKTTPNGWGAFYFIKWKMSFLGVSINACQMLPQNMYCATSTRAWYILRTQYSQEGIKNPSFKRCQWTSMKNYFQIHNFVGTETYSEALRWMPCQCQEQLVLPRTIVFAKHYLHFAVITIPELFVINIYLMQEIW